MELIEITQDGVPARPMDALPDIATDVMQATSEMYKAIGYRPPWIGYLAPTMVNALAHARSRLRPPTDVSRSHTSPFRGMRGGV